jgi:two-component system cell cycle response regulator
MTLAITDALTGLPNRRYLTNHLNAHIGREGRSTKPLAVMMVDIDHFKAVNDTYGHPVGDEVLRTVANRLSRELRGYDTVARWGGEEFAVVLPDAGPAAAAGVAERLRSAVGSHAVAVSAAIGEIKVTVSIGVAIEERGRTTGQELLAAADAALYEAKRTGRNRVSIAPSPADVNAEPALELRAAG